MPLQLLLVGALLISAALVLSAGLRTLIREDESTASLLFFLTTLGATTWLVSLALAITSTNDEAAMLWSRAALVGILLVPPAALHFTSSLCSLDRKSRAPIALIWIATLGLMGLTIGSATFIGGVHHHPWGYYARLQPTGAVLIFWALLLLGGGLAIMVREHRRRTDSATRKRLKLLTVAFAIGGLAFLDLLPAFGVPMVPLGFVSIAGFALITTHTLGRMSLTKLTPAYGAGQILATMQGAVLVTDLDGAVKVVNEAAVDLLRYSTEDLLDKSISDIIESPFNIGRASDTLMRGETIRDRPMLWKTHDARVIEVGVSASILRSDENIPNGVVYVAVDISEKRRAKQFEYQAFHDALTGLPNRTFLRRSLDDEIDRGADALVPAVIFLDLDGFKVVNDSLGHSAGDALLQKIAARLKEVVRAGDLVCRLGGDEFVVLMKISSEEHATSVGQKILQAIQERISIREETIQLSGSIGIALYPIHGANSEALLKNADTAMYAAKDAGKNQVVVCGPEIAEKASRRFRLESELRQAVENEQLELHYQPIIDLTTNELVGAEALLRWRRDGRILMPSEFLSIAEESGLVREIGEWALFMACREASRWSTATGDPLRIAVNLSTEQLRDRSITEVISSALSLNGMAPGRLVLEVTESAAMRNVEQSIRILSELKDIGVQLAIDDFGTGYSSLSYLQRLPLDLVKIDRSFTHEMERSRSSGAIVSAIIAMARALDLDVVAEGIETRYQLAALRLENCRYAQGFALGGAVDAQAFASVCRDWRTNMSHLFEDAVDAPMIYMPAH